MYRMRDDIYDNGNTGNFFEKSNSIQYVQSESDGLSVAKVLKLFQTTSLGLCLPPSQVRQILAQMGNNQELGVRSL